MTLGGHISSLGDSLRTAADHYNSLVGSIERSAFPAARKFEQLGAALGAELEQLGPIEKTTRALQSPDWKTITTDGVELEGESELEKV